MTKLKLVLSKFFDPPKNESALREKITNRLVKDRSRDSPRFAPFV